MPLVQSWYAERNLARRCRTRITIQVRFLSRYPSFLIFQPQCIQLDLFPPSTRIAIHSIISALSITISRASCRSRYARRIYLFLRVLISSQHHSNTDARPLPSATTVHEAAIHQRQCPTRSIGLCYCASTHGMSSSHLCAPTTCRERSLMMTFSALVGKMTDLLVVSRNACNTT